MLNSKQGLDTADWLPHSQRERESVCAHVYVLLSRALALVLYALGGEASPPQERTISCLRESEMAGSKSGVMTVEEERMRPGTQVRGGRAKKKITSVCPYTFPSTTLCPESVLHLFVT